MSEDIALDLDDDVIEILRRRAEATGRTLEDEIHKIITDGARLPDAEQPR